MEDDYLDPAFEKHVQDFLCSESYDFLKEATAYRKRRGMIIDDQYNEFRVIVKRFVLAGSELEVNIETAMRNKILKWNDLALFSTLDEDQRCGVLFYAEAEVRKMLEQNLLGSFLDGNSFVNACKKRAE
ncbi:unnamed protein product, partial [Choristocarpus tenellus]